MDFSIARESMVKSQIRPNQVNDAEVLGAMAELPREAFLPKALHGVAYVDEDLPLGNGRYLMEPRILARLLQAAGVRATDVAMVIGCTTGYSAAVLSRLASAVVAIESDAKLAQAATDTLAELAIDTVAVITGELAVGCPKQAPFDVILLDGATCGISDAFVEQLADGGRLVAVVRESRAMGKAVLISRKGEIIARRELFDATIPWLPGFEPAPRFVF
jgi:protein-L-isoaspartate(D-aspartate) O-methyltransferase